MSARSVITLLLTTLCCCAAVVPASALAETVVRTDPGGAVLANGSTITGTSEGTYTQGNSAGTWNMHCDASFSATLATGTGATSVSGTLTSWTLSSCFDVAIGYQIDHCSGVAPLPSVTVTAGTGGGTIAFGQLYVRCHIMNSGTPGFGCYFTSTPSGGLTNANSTLAFNATDHFAAPAGVTDHLGATCQQLGIGYSVSFAGVHTAGGTAVTLATS